MKLIPVECVPKRTLKHDLQNFIEDFMNSEAKTVKVELNKNEYKSVKICENCLRVAVKRSKRPIKVYNRMGIVYLQKKY